MARRQVGEQRVLNDVNIVAERAAMPAWQLFAHGLGSDHFDEEELKHVRK